jgi:hypothetical protein
MSAQSKESVDLEFTDDGRSADRRQQRGDIDKAVPRERIRAPCEALMQTEL